MDSTEVTGSLCRLAGRWLGRETLHSPAGTEPEGQAEGRFSNRIFEGRYLVNEYEQSVDGKVVFRGHGIYGFDPGSKCYSMYWVDSNGTPPGSPLLGVFEENQLVFLKRGDGGTTRYAYRFDAENCFRFGLSVSADGQIFQPVLTGRYERVGR